MTEFKREWKEITKNYPNFARAYAQQQILLAKFHLSISKSFCDRIELGEIVVTQEMYRKHCIKLGDIDIWESEVGRLLKCIDNPPDGDISNCFPEDE